MNTSIVLAKNKDISFFRDSALGQSAPSMAAFAKARVAAAKIFRVIDHKPNIDRNSKTGLELDSVSGQVEIKNVDFSYPSRPDVRILNNFSLSVPAGKTIALVGSSGSGKSTVVSLIERFYDPTSGNKTSTNNFTLIRPIFNFKLFMLVNSAEHKFNALQLMLIMPLGS